MSGDSLCVSEAGRKRGYWVSEEHRTTFWRTPLLLGLQDLDPPIPGLLQVGAKGSDFESPLMHLLQPCQDPDTKGRAEAAISSWRLLLGTTVKAEQNSASLGFLAF